MAQARDAATGRLLWEFEYGRDLADMAPYRRGSANAHAAPLLTPQAVYLAGLDGRLRALDRKNGKRLAVLDVGEPVVSASLGDDDTMVLTTYPGSVLSIDARIARPQLCRTDA